MGAIDRATGARTSAKDLGLSYAAFLTAISARKEAAKESHDALGSGEPCRR
ncbi:hypothetical protein CHELA40_30254 [Chelatococcus asaccharovorans]|nr:hypothetical protein CHELA17_40160 [Chelatococcus asaccharovorans]CAH1688565.1 hypothetical protein CHELA40_30254 [Chelatococcus asaccharovorans]